MKKVQLVAYVLGLAGALAASANSLTVSVNNERVPENKEFSILVRTVETHSSMCGMKLTKVEMTSPTVPFGIEIMPIADLKLSFATDPGAMCLMAFGPHRGGATFEIGQALPNLNGLYNLVINDESYGLLRVSEEDGAVLEPSAENN